MIDETESDREKAELKQEIEDLKSRIEKVEK